jgi:hypothetical protein
VIYSNHVAIMVLATILTMIKVIFVYAQLVSMVLSVKSIIDLVNRILAGIMVSVFSSLY